jgi:hypothetical protein
MLIDVTEDDITKGEPHNPCRCPIALAALRALADEKIDRVLAIFGQIIVMDVCPGTTTRRERSIKLPTAAQHFMRYFDEERNVQPFAFEAELEPSPDDPTTSAK